MTKARKQPRSNQSKSVVREPEPPPYTDSPAIARVFQSGNSQAVRLPRQFRFRSKQVQVFRRGGDIVLRERPVKLSALLDDLPPLADDAFPDEIPDSPPEPGLARFPVPFPDESTRNAGVSAKTKNRPALCVLGIAVEEVNRSSPLEAHLP